jgi:hypothetical protein
MRKRINLLALLVIAGGGAVFARPAPASATYISPWGNTQSCCTAYDGWGRVVQQCCSSSGCFITYGKCLPLA